MFLDGIDLDNASFFPADDAVMHAADVEAVFIAATMSPPGIEPPLELR
ncbi:hypothetical protein [Nocardia wallacei]|nr:hypothetical protein [Nocardia wallacei]